MSQLTAQQPQEGLNEYGRRRFIQVFAMMAVYALCLFVPAGTLRWWNAWMYLGLFLFAILTGGLYVARKNPAIINERGRPSENTKPFDRLFARLSVPIGLSTLIVAGLDHRFGWSSVPLWLQIAGFIGILPGLIMPYWVMLVNAYAATTVRVEVERGQHVITTGPYRYVRHPLYSATLFGYIFSPAAFASWWMAIPLALSSVLFIWRTANEDRTLMAELPGYQEYAQKTRYRLLPGVW
ncbi:isoprenylcysteine carboxylmethyltransferase family protein [Promineifilum sp.]|uniref:isoprenylcysteine carboxylmethyltransferase family protein n=1 Tax=Promineifilum sp. TaxID=2664178 RepID=UPI0035B1E8CF